MLNYCKCFIHTLYCWNNSCNKLMRLKFSYPMERGSQSCGIGWPRVWFGDFFLRIRISFYCVLLTGVYSYYRSWTLAMLVLVAADFLMLLRTTFLNFIVILTTCLKVSCCIHFIVWTPVIYFALYERHFVHPFE